LLFKWSRYSTEITVPIFGDETANLEVMKQYPAEQCSTIDQMNRVKSSNLNWQSMSIGLEMVTEACGSAQLAIFIKNQKIVDQ
jgi:hypothetical protein